MLLDEATASLDVENETRVQEALSRLLAGKTVLVIDEAQDMGVEEICTVKGLDGQQRRNACDSSGR